MKILLNLVLGIGISVILFFLLLFIFNGDSAPFFIIVILIGIVLGMQITVLHEIKNLK